MQSKQSLKDQAFLKEVLRLARKGMGWTNPNPMVGAVIVKRNKIIAKGYHKQVGLPHAEIEALNAATTSVKGATLYVNLEPCIHYGRTPSCVDAIIQVGIKRVVCSISDPNPKVHGRGITKLKQAGISVSLGVREKESRALNETFFTFHEKERPFIAIKFAASLDGKIATRTGDSQWITNSKARAWARSLRGVYQAVLVGVQTIIRDNPHLGVRQKGKKDPLRIVLDSTLKTSLSSKVLRDTNVLIVTTKRAACRKKQKLIQKGITVLELGNSTILLEELLGELYKRRIVSILIEGGGEVIGSFVDRKLVDKLYVFHAPIIIGGEKAISAVRGRGVSTLNEAIYLENLSQQRFSDNHLTIGYPKYAV